MSKQEKLRPSQEEEANVDKPRKIVKGNNCKLGIVTISSVLKK
jgi:hypothetical protein